MDEVQKVEAELQRVQDDISNCEAQLNRALELSEQRYLKVKKDSFTRCIAPSCCCCIKIQVHPASPQTIFAKTSTASVKCDACGVED